ICLGPDGTPLWEHGLEAAPTGVALCPSGRRLLVTLANGIAALFEVDLARGAGLLAAGRRDEALAAAASAVDARDLTRTRDSLQALLADAPHDVDAAASLAAIEERMIQGLRDGAEEHRQAGRWRAALEALDLAAGIDPASLDVLRHRRELCHS